MVLKNDDKSDTNTEAFHYIATTDKDTADKLRNLGFEEMAAERNRWVFKN